MQRSIYYSDSDLARHISPAHHAGAALAPPRARTAPHTVHAPGAQIELCPWRDANGNVDVRLFARDHSLGAGASDNETYEPVSAATSFGASGGAIAHGEAFTYTVGATLPAPGRLFTVMMVRGAPLLESLAHQTFTCCEVNRERCLVLQDATRRLPRVLQIAIKECALPLLIVPISAIVCRCTLILSALSMISANW